MSTIKCTFSLILECTFLIHVDLYSPPPPRKGEGEGEGILIGRGLQGGNIGVVFKEENTGPVEDSKYQKVESDTLTKVEVTSSFFKFSIRLLY